MVAELIDKYLWLIRTLVDAGPDGLSLQEISSRWEDRYGSEYPRRSFNNHREAVADIFGIEIECRRSDNRYFIAEGSDTLDTDKTRSWLVDTFTVNKLLELGRQRLSGRVSVENIPSGRRHLAAVMEAMLSGNVLEIGYRKYKGGGEESLHVEPWAVKEYMKRWYLVGMCRERGAIRIYGLDRITALRKSEQTFTLIPSFDVDELFAESFGVYLADPEDVRTIVFRTDKVQARYLRDLPLHPSQIETGTDDEGRVTFAFRAGVNEALRMELLRLSDKIEVLSPKELRENLRETFERAAELYKD